MKKIYVLEVRQPIGIFYVGKMCAKDIINISKVSQRKGNTGHQRQLKEKRAADIAQYCKDPDATFPTPIILSVKDSDLIINESLSNNNVICFEFDETRKFAEILDGQHRMEGISKSDGFDFELPVIIMFSLREEQKAYVFSTINGNQLKVDRSLIYDLFDLSETPSPYKTCHQIARIMNSDEKSPFYRRLKMLEKRENRSETISQNTFVTNLCALISKTPQEDEINIKRGIKIEDNPKLPLRKFFIARKDEVILRILMNYFSAAKTVFYKEWNTPEKYILTKSVGFEGLVSALTVLVPAGEKIGDLSKAHFIKVFKALETQLHKDGIELTSQNFSSSGQSANRLSKFVIAANDVVCI